MSWQRIFEAARKHGMPMIVTDVAGREPMVLMPLEAYERLSDGAEALESFEEAVLEEALESIEAVTPPPAASAGDLSMEDKFYLEPLDEDGK